MPILLFLLMFAAGEVHAACAPELDLTPITRALERIAGPPGTVSQVTRDTLAESRARLNIALGLPDHARLFENSVGVIDEVARLRVDEVMNLFTLSGLMKPDPALMAEKEALSAELGAFVSQLTTNPDFHKVFESVGPFEGDREDLRLHYLSGFVEAGAGLDEETRLQIQKTATVLSPIQTAFHQSRQTDRSSINLDGVDVPLNSIGKVQAQLASERDPETRKRIYLAFRGRMPENAQRLFEITKGNRRLAQLRGLGTHLDFKADAHSLAGSPAFIEGLLRRMAEGYRTPLRAHLARLSARKAADGFNEEIRPWDLDYYERELREAQPIDAAADVGDAFPASETFTRVTKLLGTTFDLEFREVTGAPRWDPSVRFFEVHDRRTRRLLGGLYVDLYSRAGKPADGAFISTLGYPSETKRPLVLLSANWPGPAASLKHTHIVTLLHELGHALHSLFCESLFVGTAYNGFPKDYIEMPSTTFEYLARDPATLVELSGGRLSFDTAERLRGHAAFSLTRGNLVSTTYALNTIFLALLDIEVQKAAPNLRNPNDMDEIYRRLYREILAMDPGPDDHFVQNFFHIGGSYAGEYWSYLMARLAAANVRERLEKHGGMRDRAAMSAWREMVLSQPVQTRTALQILENYLGHPLAAEPLLRELGLL